MCSVHIYLHFVIHPDNKFSSLDIISREEITDTIYYKLPFIINKITIEPLIITDCNKINKYKYSKIYESNLLLEPFVKFFTKNTIYKLNKNVLKLHSNLHCRNFYIIHKGKVKIWCIHPKYMKSELNIETNSHLLQIELIKGQGIFIPNYWGIYIKPMTKSIVEKIQYSTIMNQFNFLWNKNIKTLDVLN